MSNRPSQKVNKTLKTKRTLQEKDINDLFDMLKLSTAAERDKVLRLGWVADDNSPVQDTGGALRVVLGDSTAITRLLK